jgi:excisionase family DNA binding protein
MSSLQLAVDSGLRVLTVVEVACFLRCSKAHVHNLINGKVSGVPPLPSVFLGRRRLVRRESLNLWITQNERGVASLGVA